MCFVVQNHLGKGARCAPPLHPPGRGSVRGSTPSRASRTYRRSITRGRLRSPCTHRSFQEDQGLSRPLKPTRTVWPLHYQSGERSCSPDTPMTTSWRRLHRDRRKGAFALPFLGAIPSTWGHSAPRPPTTPARIRCAPSYRRWITLGGISPPPNPARQAWRIPSSPTPNHVQPTARLISATP